MNPESGDYSYLKGLVPTYFEPQLTIEAEPVSLLIDKENYPYSEHLPLDVVEQKNIVDISLLEPRKLKKEEPERINLDDPYLYLPNQHYIENAIISPEKHQIKKSLGNITTSNLVELISAPLQQPLSSVGHKPAFSSLISPAKELFETIKPEDLAEMSLPVVDFIDETKPHIVVGCDRGGRMFSLAVRAAWKQLHPGEKFPTIDGKVHFARISTSEDEDDVQAQFDTIVKQARSAAKAEDSNAKLRILFIDDWVAGGGTRRLTQRLAAKHGATSFFAVMRGDKADASGMPGENRAKPDWSDRPELIGVNYISFVEANKENGQLERTYKAEVLRNSQSKAIRQRMYGAVRMLVRTSHFELAA